MVIKWKKMCEKCCDIWWKCVIVWGIFFASSVLVFLGVGIAVSDSDSVEEAARYFERTDYSNSPLHIHDVQKAFEEVYQKSRSGVSYEPDEWDFKGIYDYLLEVGGTASYLVRHKTNIPSDAYTEYSKRQQEPEAASDVPLEAKLADWYFKENFSCYYVWDGTRLERGEETADKVFDGFWGDGQPVRIGIGFTEEMLEDGGVRLVRIYRHLYGGIFTAILGIFFAVLSLLVRIGGGFQGGRIRSYHDVALTICVAAAALMPGGISQIIGVSFLDAGTGKMLASIFPYAVLLGIFLTVIVTILFRIIINIRQRRIGRKDFILYCAVASLRRRITGEAYYEEGIAVCGRRRFRFILFMTLACLTCNLVIALVAAEILDEGFPWVLEGSISREGFWFILLSGIFIVLVARTYEKGNRKISMEYDKLQKQMKGIYSGDYENHDGPGEDSVFAGESRQMSMLGRQMQENIRKQIQAERMKIDLITNVSHDLKTPLTSIISYIDLLKKEELSGAAADYAKVLEKKAVYLQKMIADVFDLAKASSGNMEIRQDTVDLKMLLVQTLADMQQEIDNTPVKVVTNLPEHAVQLQSDGEKLYRILQNIVENALKYSMKGTRIYVALTSTSKDTVLRIKNVAGYEMNFTKEEVMGRFFRGDRARSTEGSGLGLAIAKEFTELCGGAFGVDIDGDVFCVELRFELPHDDVVPGV